MSVCFFFGFSLQWNELSGYDVSTPINLESWNQVISDSRRLIHPLCRNPGTLMWVIAVFAVVFMNGWLSIRTVCGRLGLHLLFSARFRNCPVSGGEGLCNSAISTAQPRDTPRTLSCISQYQDYIGGQQPVLLCCTPILKDWLVSDHNFKPLSIIFTRPYTLLCRHFCITQVM